jgi:3-deoxy-D-manno-octulosonate 8-phosphate phosphatase (KDO 8-P phosphatase)
VTPKTRLGAERALRDLFERARKIRLLALDVDGVLTDGTIWLSPKGEVTKRFHIRDGLSLMLLRRHGVELAILSGREDAATARRAEDLGIRHVLQGLKKKLPAATSLAKKLGLSLDQVAFMGDDINDVALIGAVGLGCAPADGCHEALEAARFVAPHGGGQGAVRDLAELLLKAGGAWAKVLAEA